MSYVDLGSYLKKMKPKLVGEWVKSPRYDQKLASLLKMEYEDKWQRYWDARWRGYLLEFKKGKSYWIDLVRLSESLLKVNEVATRETITVFFVPAGGKQAIERIMGVPTERLIRFFKLNKVQARRLIALQQSLPRSLNAQASIYPSDIKRLAVFEV